MNGDEKWHEEKLYSADIREAGLYSMHDNVRKKLEDRAVDLQERLPYNPDLKPIEYLWYRLQKWSTRHLPISNKLRGMRIKPETPYRTHKSGLAHN